MQEPTPIWPGRWTEYNNGEHDIPPCYNRQCIDAISSNFTGAIMPGVDWKLGPCRPWPPAALAALAACPEFLQRWHGGKQPARPACLCKRLPRWAIYPIYI